MIKIDFHTELNTTLITVSLRPVWFSKYFAVFSQTRRRPSLSFKQVVLDALFTLLEARTAGANNALKNKRHKSNHSKKRGSATRYDRAAKSGQSDTLGSIEAYRQLMGRLEKAMEIRQLSVQGKIGLDDACQTALLCGSLTAIGGMFARISRKKKGLWYVAFSPVYHRPYFALKVNTVVRVSLLNAIKLLLFAKYVMQQERSGKL